MYQLSADNIGLNADADELIRYLDGQSSNLSPKAEEMLERVIETKALIMEHKTYARVVKIIRKIRGCSLATAYRDIALVEKVIGNLVRASKDVKRAIAEEMILKSKELAISAGDTRSLAAIDKNYMQLHQLDEEDAELPDLSAFEPHQIIVAVIPDQVGIDPPDDDELESRFQNWVGGQAEDIDYEEDEEEDEG